MHAGVARFWADHSGAIKTGVLVVMVMAYSAYFAYALYYDFSGEPAIRLLWVTMLVAACFALCIVQDYCGSDIYSHLLKPVKQFIDKHWTIFKWQVFL